MMGGVAFILLKNGRTGPETAKQAEIRLASLRKILHIARFGGQRPLVKDGKDMPWLCRRRFPPDMANLPRIVRFVI
jgi:hypothetical protein